MDEESGKSDGLDEYGKGDWLDEDDGKGDGLDEDDGKCDGLDEDDGKGDGLDEDDGKGDGLDGDDGKGDGLDEDDGKQEDKSRGGSGGLLRAALHEVIAPLLPSNLMFLIGEYGISLTTGGKTQYAFFCVTVSDSLICTPASTAHSREATWLHDSPRPAAQLQWAHTILPVASQITHGISGFSLIFWEWLT